MRVKNAKYRLKYGIEIPVNVLVGKVSKRYRDKTYISGKRPFGVGLLVVGMDSKGK